MKNNQQETQRKLDQQRSKKQNRALHKFFGDLATFFIEKDIPYKVVMQDLADHELPWSKELVHCGFFKVIMFSVCRKTSTADLTKGELNECLEVAQEFIEIKYGIKVEFPSVDKMIDALIVSRKLK